MGNRSLAVGVLAVIFMLVARPALAGDAPKYDAFAQGLALQQTKQYARALDAFRDAYLRDPTPQAILHIAECEIELGRLVKAEEHLKSLVDATILEGSPPEFFAAQVLGKAELVELGPRVRVGYITVRLPPSPRGERMTVTLDGWALDSSQLGVPQRVDPGSHVVVLVAPNRVPMTTTITVQEGQTVLSEVPAGVFATATRNGTYTVAFSPALAAVGYGFVGIGAGGAGAGALVLFGTALLCTLGCRDEKLDGPLAVGGGLFLGGVGVALFVGLPMILAGNRRVVNVAPRVSVSSKGAQLGWTVPF